MIEDAGRFTHDRTTGYDVHVAKVDGLMHVEVVIADVAAADDRDGIVHDEQLVVHAMVDAAEVGEKTQQLQGAIGKRIEEADFDVRVRVQRRDDRVTTSLEGQIIDQDAHMNAPVRRADKALRKDPPGGILVPDVVLQIQRLFRQLGHRDPRGKRSPPVGEDRKSRLVRMTGGCLLEVRADYGARVVGEGAGSRAGVILRHAGAARQQDDQRQERQCSHARENTGACPLERAQR